MALAPGAAASPESGDSHIDAPQLQLFVMGLFFIFGGITSLNDVIIPKLKELFTLNYTQAMLVQFCFFAAYAVIGIPGARLEWPARPRTRAPQHASPHSDSTTLRSDPTAQKCDRRATGRRRTSEC